MLCHFTVLNRSPFNVIPAVPCKSMHLPWSWGLQSPRFYFYHSVLRKFLLPINSNSYPEAHSYLEAPNFCCSERNSFRSNFRSNSFYPVVHEPLLPINLTMRPNFHPEGHMSIPHDPELHELLLFWHPELLIALKSYSWHPWSTNHWSCLYTDLTPVLLRLINLIILNMYCVFF